jgi:hypothetical protein
VLGSSGSKNTKALTDTIDQQAKTIEGLLDRIERIEDKRAADREVNDALINALQARRKAQLEILPLLSGAFTTGLVLTFAYQVYKGTEVSAQLKEMDKQVQAIEARGADIKNLESQLELQRDSQALLAGRLTRALVLTSIGYRDSARGRELSAFRKAEAALEELRDWLPLLDVAQGVKGSSTINEVERAKLEAVRPSMKALLEAAIAAYEQIGRSSVLLYNEQHQEFIQRTVDAGKRIYALDPNRWEGPHFIAIANDNMSDYAQDKSESLALRKQAQKYYQMAIQIDPKNASVDLINLSESLFVMGNYKEASDYASRYLDQEGGLAPEEHKLVCGFYSNLGRYGASGEISDARKAYQVIRTVATKSSKVFKNYSWEPLRELFKRKLSGFKVDKAHARVMLDCVGAILDAEAGATVQDLDKKYGKTLG